MNTRDMECFCTITREKSITKASRVLYMSPQGLSKIIKNLENEIGSKLLIRNSNGIELTESGVCFYENVQKILSDYQNMTKDIRNIEHRYAGNIDLLSAYGVLRLVTPDCILDFHEKYPEIGLHYREYPDLEVERRFLEKDGNVAFAIGPFQEDLYDAMFLTSYQLKLLVYKDHPLASRESVTIEDLKDEPLYIESTEFKLHHIILKKCEKAGFEPNIIFSTSGFSLCHKMCRAGKGISITTDFVTGDMDLGNLVAIPFSDGDYPWAAYMITRKGETITPELQQFHHHISNQLKAIREGIITR